MKFTFKQEALDALDADYSIRFVDGAETKGTPDEEILEISGFEKGSICDLPERRRVYVSITDAKPDNVRLGMAKALRAINGHKIGSIAVAPAICETAGVRASAAALAEGALLGAYKFDKYISDTPEKRDLEILVAGVCRRGSVIDAQEAERGLEQGAAVADVTNWVRDIVNEVPQIYTPAAMARDAAELACSADTVSCEVYDRVYLVKEGMNAFLAVNQSSPHEPKLIHIVYKPECEPKKRIAFVGKGLTYDSGGLSLKPSQYMLTMKSDKGGAAAAMGIVKAASALALPLEVHAVLGCTENMIGANAYKPDDIVTARNGKTIEVVNTDAEGRLVLADCLSWTQDKIKPDIMIDLATLTGACVTGLGAYTTGVIGNSYELQTEFKKLAEKSGELYSILEFNDYLRKEVDSKIADCRNAVPNGTGGAITAGEFLNRFIDGDYKDKWLHLDIAGPAFAENAWGYNPEGATGAGVRGCIYYMLGI